MMKVMFIVPAMGRRADAPYVSSWKMEPLTIATLAALTPDDIETKFYDDRIENIPFEESYDLVAINVEAYTATRAYYIADKFRKRGAKVVMGGFHATLMPQEVMEHADAVVKGEAENIWPEVIEDAKKEALKKLYESKTRPQMGAILPDRTIYAGKKYLPLTLVETTRGCNQSCNFCSISAFYNKTHSFRPIEEVLRDIERIKRKIVFFVDDNIAANPQYAKELCGALISRRIKWISQCSLKAAEHPGLLELMKKSGCLGMLIGLESLSGANLTQMNKSWNGAGMRYGDAIKKFRDNGIAIYATFIFGYDCETPDTIKRAVDFAVGQKFLIAAFNHLLPFPGTPLYSEFAAQGRLISDKWWLEPKYRYGDIVFKPKNFTPEGLARACVQARKNFYSAHSILRRVADFKANSRTPWMFFAYLWCNMLLRREVAQKRSLILGERCNV